MSRISEIINILNTLPKGYISKKTINNKVYYYLQYLSNGKLISEYIKHSELETIKNKLTKRKQLEEELESIFTSGKSLKIPSNYAKNLTGQLMSMDKVVASFKDGELKYVDEKLCPLFILRTHNIKHFLASRAIDSSRANSRLLKKALNINEKEDEIVSLYSHGATITDTYWFKAKGSKLKYEDIRFDNNIYSDLALNGELIVYPKIPRLTPELTTPGSYEKCWKKINDEWWLYKKGNQEEIFSELFCSELAFLLNIPTASYEYIDGVIRTRNFAIKYNFEPMTSIAGDDDSYERVFNLLYSINKKLAKEYILLMWFDVLVNNVDRHNENCGLLRNRKTGDIVCLAPNFDNNLALISRSKILNMDASKDGFINVFIKFLKKNENAYKIYKDIKLPKLNAKTINECFKVIEIKQDEDMIRKYLLNRYSYLIYFQQKQ